MFTSYGVLVEKFAERHYISKFKKKHKGAWEVTWSAMEEQFRRIEAFLGVSNMVEIIRDTGEIRICKTEFRIAGPGKSRHASGNRCIIAVHKATTTVHVLLVYSKGDMKGASETIAWKSLIKEQYLAYRHLL